MADRLQELTEAIIAAGIPVRMVRRTAGVVQVDPLGLTAPQLTTAQTMANGWDFSPSASPDVQATARLAGVSTTLRQWAADAVAATAAWDTATQTQKNATMKTVLQRMGTLMDRLADLLQNQGIR